MLKLMKDLRIGLECKGFEQFIKTYEKDGLVNYERFMDEIIGEMKETRKKIVFMAFGKLDILRDGKIPLDTIKDSYNAKNHPDCITNKKTEGEVLSEFFDTLDQFTEIYVNNNLVMELL
jgi:hypothetical protein